MPWVLWPLQVTSGPQRCRARSWRVKRRSAGARAAACPSAGAPLHLAVYHVAYSTPPGASAAARRASPGLLALPWACLAPGDLAQRARSRARARARLRSCAPAATAGQALQLGPTLSQIPCPGLPSPSWGVPCPAPPACGSCSRCCLLRGARLLKCSSAGACQACIPGAAGSAAPRAVAMHAQGARGPIAWCIAAGCPAAAALWRHALRQGQAGPVCVIWLRFSAQSLWICNGIHLRSSPAPYLRPRLTFPCLTAIGRGTAAASRVAFPACRCASVVGYCTYRAPDRARSAIRCAW